MTRLAVVAACLAGYAAAFPRLESHLLSRAAAPPQGAGALPVTPPPFDASAQYVSTTGAHAFVAPGPGDARGECPGLNAMANHGYLPHNGVATIAQFTQACQTVFGMGADLAAFLAVYGAVVDGDLTSWSIGGLPHTGIGGSHNDYETDSSPLHADLYQYGNLYDLPASQAAQLLNMQSDASTANYNLEILREFRATRFQQSISENPKFFYGPFTGMAVSQAAFTFIYRFMANKSSEAPEGILNQDVLKSFYALSGTNDKPVYTPGHNRIPDNWYKRNTIDAYTIPYFLTDVLYFSETFPQLNGVGCNNGSVNTYDTISVSTLTNGAYTAAEVAANPICFALEYAMADVPSLTGLPTTALAPLASALSSATSELKCKPIAAINNGALEACPGFTLYGGPTAPVAKGAIQPS